MTNLLNKTYWTLQMKTGLAASINALATVYTFIVGELAYTTDTKKLYVFDGTANRRVHGLDTALVFEGEILTFNKEILWKGEY